jgi:O-methyltransferase involved in polyketide biosynthesis
MQKFPPITLKGQALDSRTKHPALGDPLADELIRAIDTAVGVYWYDVDLDEVIDLH